MTAKRDELYAAAATSPCGSEKKSSWRALAIAGFALLLAGTTRSQTEVPGFTLPDTVQPMRYALDLTIHPDRPTFEGTVAIDVDVKQPVPVIWLNQRQLTIRDAEWESSQGVRAALQAIAGTDEVAGFAPAAAGRIMSGRSRLTIRYTGKLDEKSNDGIFRRFIHGDWYVFTTFTPIEARRAFPCFDEPRFKAPWKVTLHVPRAEMAVSNGAVESERDEAGGMKRVAFHATAPLASEVVAFAVGPFEAVDAGRAGSKRIPVRILTPRGQSREAEAAREATPEILRRLEAYTGIPYPWEKLDHLALVKGAYGAVENPGLITYQEEVLLSEPSRDTPARQQRMRSTIAHELAHQWFGNLVTQASWTDAWLSEGFATWLASKVMAEDYPAFERAVAGDDLRLSAESLEHLHPTWPVRRSIESRNEAQNVYNGLIYAKGAAILDTVEDWLGAAVFERGLRQYLTAHAYRTANVDDLASALQAASGKDVAPILHSLLDHPGTPELRMTRDCRRLTIDAATWSLPVCIHSENGARSCTSLHPGQNEIELKTEACPAWIWTNASGRGYYRSLLSDKEWTSVGGQGYAELSAAEKRALMADVGAALTENRVSAAAAMKLLAEAARDGEPRVQLEALRVGAGVSVVVPPEVRNEYSDWLIKTFGVSAASPAQSQNIANFLVERAKAAREEAH